jgi:hypothetical protein
VANATAGRGGSIATLIACQRAKRKESFKLRQVQGRVAAAEAFRDMGFVFIASCSKASLVFVRTPGWARVASLVCC